MAEKPKAVVLLSGGMDSCVTAAIAHETHRLALVHASYGQRTERRERQAPPGRSGTIPPTYVPFRNAHFLSVAVSWAEVIAATAVFIGAVAEDSSGYPDCRPEYYRVFANLV